MSPTDTAPFPALAALQDAHADMLGDVGGNLLVPEHATRIRDFVNRSVASGTRLDAKEDRSMAQGLVNFWAARVSAAVRTARDDSAPRTFSDFAFDDTLLADFDPGTLRDAVAAGERWLAEQTPEDRNLARRIALRLTRLQPEGSQFDAVPTVRAAFHDLDTPERVDTVLDGLAGAGVVRVTRAEEPRMDRVSLRAAELLTTWPALAGWLGERSRFRDGAAAWEAGNKPAEMLLVAGALDEARNYHDRNRVEREFVIDSAYRQERELELAVSNRRAKWIFGILAAVAAGIAVVCWFGWQRAVKDAAEQKSEQLFQEMVNSGKLITEEQQTQDAVKRADDAALELDARKKNQRLANLARVIRALAEVGTYSGEERRVALWRWNGIVDSYPSGDEFRKYLQKYDVPLDNLPEDSDAKRIQDTGRKALNIARALKNETDQIPDSDTVRAREAMRKVAYGIVEKASNRAVEAYGSPKATSAEAIAMAMPAVKEFWVLYWGEMGMFEGGVVIDAMRAFGDQLKVIENDSNSVLSADDLKKLSRQSVTQALNDWKNIPDRQADLARLTGELKKKTIPAAFLRELAKRQKALVAALLAESESGGVGALQALPSAY